MINFVLGETPVLPCWRRAMEQMNSTSLRISQSKYCTSIHIVREVQAQLPIAQYVIKPCSLELWERLSSSHPAMAVYPVLNLTRTVMTLLSSRRSLLVVHT